jgi:hypothetical protein
VVIGSPSGKVPKGTQEEEPMKDWKLLSQGYETHIFMGVSLDARK